MSTTTCRNLYKISFNFLPEDFHFQNPGTVLKEFIKKIPGREINSISFFLLLTNC